MPQSAKRHKRGRTRNGLVNKTADDSKEAMMNNIHKGTCFCGAVEFEVTGAPEVMGYCHCGDCADQFLRLLDY